MSTIGPTIKPPSPVLLAIAERYLRRFLARHFCGLRIAADGAPPDIDGPVVFYSNHPGWWDPIVLMLVIRRHYRDRRFHGPIEAGALERYPLLEHLGLFGLPAGPAAGARAFLAVGDQLLGSSHAGVVMTAQGRFADVRERPVRLKRGLAHLLKRHRNASAWPVAIEYAFWNERLPEVLVRFAGSPVTAGALCTDSIHDRLERALETELNTLAAQAKARDASLFHPLIDGRRGVGFLQDLPLRVRSMLRGVAFDPSHAALGRDTTAGRDAESSR